MTEGYYLYEFNEHAKTSVEHIIKTVGVPKTVIELGVYQGYFTFNLTHTATQVHSDYKHYAIDPYTSSPDLDDDMIEQAYKCFLHNMRVSPRSNHIELIRDTSWNGMIKLLNRGVKADLIYVDGDHRAGEVLDDMVLAFKLLNVGGVMLCDDSVSWCYTEKNKQKPLQYSPRLAVDSFIQCNWDKVEVMILPNGYQTAFIKRDE
jgi:predicted O-methyltransferase YrrM